MFEALIVPHRSLTPRGSRWVIGTISGFGLAIGLRFWALGAWPVLPFAVVEVGLVVLMLHMNNRQARASELILLTDDSLRIIRTEPSGQRREISLPAGWLSVSLEERGGRVPRLMLRRQGVSEEIARVLGEDAKRELAESLARAVHLVRNPVFDNPQLRE